MIKNITNDLQVHITRVRRYLQDHRVADRPRFEKFRFRFYEELWRQTAADMGAEIEDFGNGYFKITYNGDWTFVLEAKVMLDDHLSLRMAGNKPLVHRLLSEGNYPIQDYCEYSLHNLGKALDFIRKTGGPCVVKPAAGSGAGNGITTKILTRRQLKKASLWAATFSPRLLIEQEIPGDSYRLIYLGGEFLDAVRRDPPVVTGDGRSSIKKLMLQENRRRLSAAKLSALSPLVIDYETVLCLRRQGLKLGYVPGQGEKVVLKTVCNQNTAAENESVTAEVHPDTIRYGAEIARMFKLELVGVDLITPDVSKPLEAVGGVINEINTNPGIHHHYLINNPAEGVPVAQKIIEYIFAKTSQPTPTIRYTQD